MAPSLPFASVASLYPLRRETKEKERGRDVGPYCGATAAKTTCLNPRRLYGLYSSLNLPSSCIIHVCVISCCKYILAVLQALSLYTEVHTYIL